jgi:hypothetical protein
MTQTLRTHSDAGVEVHEFASRVQALSFAREWLWAAKIRQDHDHSPMVTIRDEDRSAAMGHDHITVLR